MIERLQLEQFTAFNYLDLQFSPGINVIIGKNGTGKTHILKVLYSVIAALYEGKHINDKIVNVFLPKGKNIDRLVRKYRGKGISKVKITLNDKIVGLNFSTVTIANVEHKTLRNEEIDQPVFIPVKEMLSNAPGFLSLYESREIHFDETYKDILIKAFLPRNRGRVPKESVKLMNIIQKSIEGKVIEKNETFYLKNKRGELEFDLLAEGMRKFGLLWLLIQNGTLTEGSTLFWDEPEANLNPSMLETLVTIFLQLQSNGVQIFIATHNYVLLKQLELQKTSKDNVTFFSLSHDEKDNNNITAISGKSYLDIVPNKISEAYTKIYDEEIGRKMKGLV